MVAEMDAYWGDAAENAREEWVEQGEVKFGGWARAWRWA